MENACFYGRKMETVPPIVPPQRTCSASLWPRVKIVSPGHRTCEMSRPELLGHVSYITRFSVTCLTLLELYHPILGHLTWPS